MLIIHSARDKYVQIIFPRCQTFDAVEVFAGAGALTRCLRLANYVTASLDIDHWDPYCQRRVWKRLKKPACTGNPLDLMSPAGFAFPGVVNLLCGEPLLELWLQRQIIIQYIYACAHLRLLLSAILHGKDQLVVTFGLVCSSFVTISRGSTHRHFFLPEGDADGNSVQVGNCLAARTYRLPNP